MDLYIERTDLLRGVKRAQGIAERHAGSLALSHVLLSAEGDRLRLTATDSRVTLVGDYAARVERPGELTVDAATFQQVVNSLPGGSVRLRDDGSRRLHVEAEHSEFHLPALDPAEFPPVPGMPDDAAGVTVEGALLRRVIEETVYAVSPDESRYGLNGGHVEEVVADDGAPRMRLVATDGSRLSWSEIPFEGQLSVPPRVLLPRKALDQLRRLCDEAGAWRIAFAERYVSFETEGLRMIAALVEGEFPDYRRVLPQGYSRRAVLERAAFDEALRRVSVVASDRNHSVRFSFEEDRLVLTADNVDTGGGRTEVAAEFEGEPMRTGFNVSFFLDVLRSTRGERVALEMGEPLDPCVVRLDDRDDCLFIVMPMRLD